MGEVELPCLYVQEYVDLPKARTVSNVTMVKDPYYSDFVFVLSSNAVFKLSVKQLQQDLAANRKLNAKPSKIEWLVNALSISKRY